MKRIFKYLMMTVIAAGTMFYSCETTELEDLVSPNALSADLADADLLLNSIQINYLGAMQDMQFNGAALGRISYMGGRVYYNNFGSGTVSGAWSNLYSGMMPDIAAIEAQNGEDNLLAFHLGISKAMAAHVLMGIVDSVGDVPFTQANNPEAYPNPQVDDDESVYNAAMAMLDEAETYLSAAGSGDDLFYNGDISNWMRFINTLRFRYHLTVGTDPNTILAFISANDIISVASADMQFNYGSQELQPDTRHPWYQSDYTTSGANIYQSSWLMDIMSGDKLEWFTGADGAMTYPGVGFEEDGAAQSAVQSDDPRRRYYFYRQSWVTPGQSAMVWGYEAGPYVWPLSWGGGDASTTANGETLQCSLQLQPFHLDFTEDGEDPYGMVGRWCSNFLGYWGRHHGNDEGTPPDNFTRTAVGVYPAGGSFDNQPDVPNSDNDGIDLGVMEERIRGAVWQGNGGGGAGIWPIYLSSYVHFMVAETQLAAGDAAGAAASMQIAMEHSFAKVLAMGSIDPDADSNYFADPADVDAFIARKVLEFNDAPENLASDPQAPSTTKDKLDVLGEQYFVAMYGGANDAWNFIRRTGHPRHLSRGLMDNIESGDFPRTGTYPSSEISANPNILQRQDNATLVFWDEANGAVTNPAN